MAQVSRRKIDDKQWQLMWVNLIELMKKNMSNDETEIVLSGLLTKTEQVMVVKRLMVWILLESGWSVPKISQTLKLSTATVYKFQYSLRDNSELNQILKKQFPDNISKPKRKSTVEEIYKIIENFFLFTYKVKYPHLYKK